MDEDENIIDPKHNKVLEQEKADFDKLSAKEKTYLQAERLLHIREPLEMAKDNNLWWNRL